MQWSTNKWAINSMTGILIKDTQREVKARKAKDLVKLEEETVHAQAKSHQ